MSACYKVSFDAAGKVVGVSADLVVTDLALNASSSPVAVAQDWSVSFVSASGPPQRSAALGNLMDFSRSGNPGYVTGRPLLAGYRVGGSAINAQLPGLRVGWEVGPGGQCLQPPSSTAYSPSAHAGLLVQFGVDMQAGCSLRLTRAQLRAMCNGAGPYMSAGSDVPVFLRVNASHVGIFGNADPLDASQWLVLDQALGTSTSSWDEQRGVCRDMYAALHFRFLTAQVGSAGNPQNKVIAAQVRE